MKKTAIILVTSFMTAISGVSANASQTSVNITYDSASELVELNGDATGITTIRVTPDGTDYDSLSDSNRPTDISQIVANGKLNYDFYMPDDAAKGKYTITVTDDFGSAEDSFIYFSASDAEPLLEQVEKTASKAAFVEMLTSGNNLFQLGIDSGDESFSTDVLEMMYDLYDDYANVTDFYNKYSFCVSVCSLKDKSISETEAILKSRETVLGIDYDKDYKNNALLSDAAKNELCILLSGMNYADVCSGAEAITKKSGFAATLETLSALASVRVSASWKETERIYTEDFAFLKENVVSANRDYENALASDVYVAMAYMSFESPSDLKDNFDKAVSDSQPIPSKRPSSGGGGGGGSFGGSVSLPVVSEPSNPSTEVYEEIPDDVSQNSTIVYNLPTLGEEVKSFCDVSESAWYYNVVSALGGANIISGDETGHFRPDANITRAEFAKLVVSAFSIKGSNSNGTFQDVSSDAWYAPYIKTAADSGIMLGDDNGKFRPDDNITRQDAAVIIYRVADLIGKPYIGFKDFKDRDDVSLYAWNAVGALYHNAIISGVGDDVFAPHSDITRAQAAQILYNCLTDMTSEK